MDILNPSIQNTPYFQTRVSIFSPKYSFATTSKSPFLRVAKPYSKSQTISSFPLYSSFSRYRKFQISAQFSRQTGYRRNSLRQKLTGKQQVRDSPLIYEPSSDFENPVDKKTQFFQHSDNRRNSLREKLPEQPKQSPVIFEPNSNAIPPNSDNYAIKDGDLESSSPSAESDSLDKLSKVSVLLKQLESWADQYKADSEFWGIGSNPIFTVFQDSDGKVERVDVDEGEILIRSGIEPSLYKSESEEFKEVDSKIVHARSIARETEIGNHVFRNSSVAKFVVNSGRKVGFLEGIKEFTSQLPLNSRTSRIGIVVLCSSFVVLTLKWFLSTRKKMKTYTPLQKEMLSRKMKARMEKENLVKGSVEVVQDLEKPNMESIGRPLIQNQEILDSIVEMEVLKDHESIDLNDKIGEIRVMARSAREIEKRESLQGQLEDDQTTSMLLDDDDEEEEKVDDPIVNEVLNDKVVVVANENKKMVIEVSNDSVECKSDLKEEKILNILENNEAGKSSRPEKRNGREKPRVIRSVKEGREYLSQKRKEKNLEPQLETVVQEVDSVSILENEKENDVKSKLLDSNGILNSSIDYGNVEANLNENIIDTNLDESEASEKKIGVVFDKSNQESQSEQTAVKEIYVENKRPISNDFMMNSDHIDATLNKENIVERKLDETEAVAKKIEVGFENMDRKSQFRKSVEEKVDAILSEVIEKDNDVRIKVPNSNEIQDSTTEKDDNKVESNRESWAEKNLDEFEPMAKKIGLGFRDNFMMAKDKKNSELGLNIEMIKPKLDDEDGELEWMKDEKLREIVFQVRENELLGRDPFYLMDVEDKNAFFKGLEKKVDKMNEQLQPLHNYLHSNIENIDYGSAGISIYDTPDKIYPRWKGPPIESTPEFLEDYAELKNSLVSQDSKKNNNSKSKKPVANTPTIPKTTTANKKSPKKAVKTPKTVIEGSDGSVKAGKKTGKEYWAHTKKYSRDFLDVYNAEKDPEVKAVMKTIGQDLDRWITEDELKEAAELMDGPISEKRKQIIEKKLHNLKREMNTYGPQAVANKYREYEEDEKEVDYFWWLDLPYIMCIELHTKEDGVEGGGYYSLEMAADLDLKPKQYHVIGFQDIADSKNFSYIIQSHMEMQGTGNAFVVARPPKEAYREARASGYGVTVIKKGEIEMNVDQSLDELEEQIVEIGTKMYEDKVTKGRSVDINSVMRGVLSENKKKEGKPKRTSLKQKIQQLKELEQKLKKIQVLNNIKPIEPNEL